MRYDKTIEMRLRVTGGKTVFATLAMGISLAASSAEAEPFAYVASQSTNTVTVIDTATNAVVRKLTDGFSGPRTVTVASDGKRAYTGPYVSVIETATSNVTPTGIYSKTIPALSPDGARLYIGYNNSNNIRGDSGFKVIDAYTYREISDVGVRSNWGVISQSQTVVSPDEKWLYWFDNDDPNFALRSFNLLSHTNGWRHLVAASNYGYCALSPNGRSLYAPYTVTIGFQDSKVANIDTVSHTTTSGPTILGLLGSIAVAPDGKSYYVARFESGSFTVTGEFVHAESSVLVFNAATDALVTSVSLNHNPTSLASTPDGKQLYATTGDGVTVIDAVTNTVKAFIPVAGATAIGIIPPPMGVPFYEFSADLQIQGSLKSFKLSSRFTLSSDGDTFKPLTQPVRIMVGNILRTISPGSFVQRGRNFDFDGVIDGTRINVKITAYDSLHYALTAQVKDVNLAGMTDPVPVSISVGTNAGRIEKTMVGRGS